MLITDLWAQQSGRFFCISTKDGDDNWKDNFFTVEEFGNIRRFLLDNQDKNIYFCPHGFNRRVRQKTEAVLPNLLWADLDDADPRDMSPKPTIAIQSSPGRYVGIWKIKGPMTESMNRRLTYKVGADPGGWDLTQVLRFPGTRNYKYNSQPRVRVLWDEGKEYSIKQIEKLLPEADPLDINTVNELRPASEVFDEYSNKLPRWVRRELLSKKIVGRTDRSEMLWKLENACLEAGMTIEESISVLRNCVWNKFSGRRNEIDQLRHELEKAADQHFNERPRGSDALDHKSDKEEQQDEGPLSREIFDFKPMSEIEREEIDFLWWPYLARQEVSILEGDPGLGKSYMAQMVCGALATGQRVPSQKKLKKVKGPVVYLDIENNAATVSKPRLEDNGYTNLTNYYPLEAAFSIDNEDALEELFRKLEKVQPIIVVFDTLNTYIGRADTHKASEVTQAFGIFKLIARTFNCAVLVLRHLTKGAGSAMYRGQGSIAFSGSARVVMSVGVDPQDTATRAMAITKINFAKAPKALTFRIEERPKGRSEFVWGEFVDLTSQEIMDAASNMRSEGTQGDGIQDAMEFLEGNINGAAVDVQRLYRMADKRSISRKMLDRASVSMGIIKKRKNNIESWGRPDDTIMSAAGYTEERPVKSRKRK